jgi:hypothetical protein
MRTIRLAATGIYSGLRRTSIPCAKQMALHSKRAMDKYRLHGKGGVNRTVYLRNKTLAQQFVERADNAGRIVVVGLKRCNLRTGRTVICKMSGLWACEGMGVPLNNMNLGK